MAEQQHHKKKRHGCLDVLLVFIGLTLASTSLALAFGSRTDWDSPGARAATYPDTTEIDSTFVPESKYISFKKN